MGLVEDNRDKNYNDHKCYRGILTTIEEETGEQVPFLVIVRSSDIIWDTPKDTPSGSTVVNPTATTRFKKDGWQVELNSSTLIYKATKRVRIGRADFKFEENDTSDLYLNMSIPYLTLVDDNLVIHTTVNSALKDIQHANLYTFYDNDGNQSISQLKVGLYNPITKFDPDFKNNMKYKESTILVEISGKIST